MLQLAAIIALVILNGLCLSAFRRWKTERRHQPRTLRTASYPLHPSPLSLSPLASFDAVPEHAAHIRPAGIDW
jgi:hypothetical protein